MLTKYLITLLLLLCIVIIIVGCSSSKGTEKSYIDDKFKPGQVWMYAARKGEENSKIKIIKVENNENLGVLVHISVSGVLVKNPNGKDSTEISHLPYKKDILENSVTELVSENEKFPDSNEGYNQWKSAFDKGQAGVWSIPVAEAINAMEEALIKK